MNLAELRRLSQADATGEFICADKSDEVHVHLQLGRIAWATTSSAPFEFACQIRHRGRIDHETFRSVVEECRRNRLPLGETLIAWGLVSQADVEHALTQQVIGALASLRRLRAARSLFLKRPLYVRYNSALTLPLTDDLLRRLPSDERRALTPPRAARYDVAELAAKIAGAAWIAVERDGDVVEVEPASAPPSASVREPLRRLLNEGADFVALRSPSGSVLGASMVEAGTHLYCGLANDAMFGPAVARIWGLPQVRSLSSLSGTRPAVRERGQGEEPLFSIGSEGSAESVEMRGLIERAPELVAAVLLDGEGMPLSAVGRCGPDDETIVPLAMARRALLSAPLEADAGPSSLGSLGFTLRRCVVGGARWWCFGAQLDDHTRRTAWLFVTRATAQGLGWACLSALLRGLRPRRISAR